jgi:hypothetical protein
MGESLKFESFHFWQRAKTEWRRWWHKIFYSVPSEDVESFCMCVVHKRSAEESSVRRLSRLNMFKCYFISDGTEHDETFSDSFLTNYQRFVLPWHLNLPTCGMLSRCDLKILLGRYHDFQYVTRGGL